MSEESRPKSIYEELAIFQQALGDYGSAHCQALTAWDKVQSLGCYKSWKQVVKAGNPPPAIKAWSKVTEESTYLDWLKARSKFNEAREVMLNARASLIYALSHWEIQVL